MKSFFDNHNITIQSEAENWVTPMLVSDKEVRGVTKITIGPILRECLVTAVIEIEAPRLNLKIREFNIQTNDEQVTKLVKQRLENESPNPELTILSDGYGSNTSLQVGSYLVRGASEVKLSTLNIDNTEFSARIHICPLEGLSNNFDALTKDQIVDIILKNK